jgi:hypothetical protein
MNILERLAAAREAAFEHYGTPAGRQRVLSIRFGLPAVVVDPMITAAMWRTLVAERQHKLRVKLGLDEEVRPDAVALEPSRRQIAEGIKFARCAEADLPKGALAIRNSAWASGWTVTATRWVGLLPHRKRKGDPWQWIREQRVALWLEGENGERAVGHWSNGSWESGWHWRPGEFRQPIGNRALATLIKAGGAGAP